MEIEKTLTVAAPCAQVWAMLLDPQVMGGAVPGMQSIEVISPTEYVAVMHQKISFISAKFRLRTHIVEQRAPEYLRAEGTGEDASVASSLKQQTEVFLTPTPDGGTELRIKVQVDVLGRLGTFGLSVMKTKADRLWDEFGANLKARIESGGAPQATPAPVAAPSPSSAAAPATAAMAPAAPRAAPVEPPQAPRGAAPVAAAPPPGGASAAVLPAGPAPAIVVEPPADTDEGGFWSRLLGGSTRRASTQPSAVGRSIRVEVRRLDRTISVEWPLEDAARCREWLNEVLK
jgi:carbon monoxide dehydrogenase subunit G